MYEKFSDDAIQPNQEIIKNDRLQLTFMKKNVILAL